MAASQPTPIVNPPEPDPQFQAQVQRLHHLTLLFRWLTLAGLWMTVGSLSLWGLREPIALLQDYFTWTALRYGMAFHPIAALGFVLCLVLTVSSLVWHLRLQLWGWPSAYRHHLEQRLLRIRQQGHSHPLWKWIDGR